ncbi:MAG: YfiR family protein [Methylovulum sp.]|nr:YfiR family protein [Methylovulum sp.]
MCFLERKRNDLVHTIAIRRLSWLFFCLASLLSSQPLYADGESVEYKIKAGYLYNFTKFIDWPADNYKTFNLCILGTDPFGSLIDPIEEREVFGRPIKLFRLNNGYSFTPNKLAYCHIFFIGEPSATPPTLHNQLTVGESPGFAQHGGMIGFINQDGRIKLQINLAAIKQSGLKISAKLLEVADIIDGDKQ